MSDDLPWSDRVRLDQIAAGVHRDFIADEATRARVAEALDLISVPKLEARVDLKPAGRGWRLDGAIDAEVVQACVVTLEPLPAVVKSRFSVDLVEAAPERETVIDIEIDNPDGPDEIEDGGVDLAAYVVEHLFLALDPYPRKPGAVFEAPATEAEPSPFDILKSLKPGD